MSHPLQSRRKRAWDRSRAFRPAASPPWRLLLPLPLTTPTWPKTWSPWQYWHAPAHPAATTPSDPAPHKCVSRHRCGQGSRPAAQRTEWRSALPSSRPTTPCSPDPGSAESWKRTCRSRSPKGTARSPREWTVTTGPEDRQRHKRSLQAVLFREGPDKTLGLFMAAFDQQAERRQRDQCRHQREPDPSGEPRRLHPGQGCLEWRVGA